MRLAAGPVPAQSGTARGRACREPAPHLLQLHPRGHLLREQRGLDTAEQPFQPADQLRLRDPQLGVGGRRVLGERPHQPLQLVLQLRRQRLLQFADGGLVDLAHTVAAGVVQRRGADLFQQLLDHRADAHHLGGFFDEVAERLFLSGLVVGAGGGDTCGADRGAVGTDDHHVVWGVSAAVTGGGRFAGNWVGHVLHPGLRRAPSAVWFSPPSPSVAGIVAPRVRAANPG